MRRRVNKVIAEYEVIEEIRLGKTTLTVEPVEATTTIVIVTAVYENAILDNDILEHFTFRTLDTDKATDVTLERTTAYLNRCKVYTHTVRVHIGKVITNSLYRLRYRLFFVGKEKVPRR